jgi:hypothetical protein
MPQTSADSGAPLAAGRAEWTLAILFVVIALASQCWQPFALGFYHDDWAVYVQARLHAQDLPFFQPYLYDRPVLSIFIKLMPELWDGRTTTFHLIKVLIDLLTATSLAWVILVYQRAFGARSFALAASGAAFWLVAPWSLGYSLWGTAAFTNIAVLFLCLSMIFLPRWIERRDFASLALTTAAFATSALFYSSTSLAPFPFALVLGWREWRNQRPLSSTITAFLLLGIVQLGAAALAWFTSPRTPNPQVIALFRENMKQLLRLGVEHFGATGNAALVAAIILAAAVAIVILWFRGGSARTRAIAGLLLLLTGITATCAVYASAGYGIATDGVMSRTTQILNFWIAVGGAILFAPSPEKLPSKFRYLGLAVSLMLVGPCTLAYWSAARPWVRSWELQQAVLDKSGPLAAALRDGDVVVADVPLEIDHVVVFGAPWDITPGVLVQNADRRPDLAYHAPSVQIVPPYGFEMSWTPGKFTITPGWTIAGKRLLLWQWRSGAIITVDHAVANRAELFALFDSH